MPIATWITSGELEIAWSLRIDTLTAVMLVVVTTVSSLVHTLLDRLHGMTTMPARGSSPTCRSLRSRCSRLVTSDNLVQMFFGWEGVGLASYLLIGFWYKKPTANAAAIKAFVVNRVGDFGFALGIFGLFAITNSVGLDDIFREAPNLVGKNDAVPRL